jgi:ribosomal-protein-alanine N-acetyltransferase
MDARYRTRPATRADLAAVARIEARSFADPWSADAFRRYLGGCFLVAEEGDAVIGYIVARTAAVEGEILDVAVDPDARRRGLGRRLVQEAISALRARGVQQVFLEVRESNAAARHLYADLGFRPVGRRPGYYRQPTEDALVLERLVAADA